MSVILHLQADNSSYPVSSEHRGITSGELLFLKIDEMDRSVKV